ncbi:unnamed protein product [Brassica rapa subsp. trilocularis]
MEEFALSQTYDVADLVQHAAIKVLNLSGDLEILVFGRVPPSLDRLLLNASWIDVVGRVKPEGNP